MDLNILCKLSWLGLMFSKHSPDGIYVSDAIRALASLRPWVQILTLPQGNICEFAEAPMAAGLS